ncbi:hypothetical protein BU25DRAFT_465119 [Macroventuria anomochaeta]|uniref:Uncharacterized protein n=1 Tax=Macroventuria anomochaeta TaxID=301207 RepID=A0ACB6SI96_9PLEO|nr:uncharacterized protein BU25DRAFT_465119 [Macroventuria anomochaeta]KAF2633896.1 hypothetical protein BU25DRAFT_465119 [Macroventuria anomochaeta]
MARWLDNGWFACLLRCSLRRCVDWYLLLCILQDQDEKASSARSCTGDLTHLNTILLVEYLSWSVCGNIVTEDTRNLLQSLAWCLCFGPDTPLRPIRFRKEFTLPEDVTSNLDARRLYITAFGIFEAYINGRPVSNELFAPGWISYSHRWAYRIYDVTSLVLPGHDNVICAEVGDGWYAGRIGPRGGQSFTYGKDIGLAAQLEIQKYSKNTYTVLTDDTWSCTPNARVHSQLYDSETYDTREDQEDWATLHATRASGRMSEARALLRPSAELVAINATPVRFTETVACRKVFTSENGQTILDFGQDLVSRLFVPCLDLDAGHEVV